MRRLLEQRLFALRKREPIPATVGEIGIDQAITAGL